VPGQIEQVKQIDKEVKRSAKLAEFMQAHAERFGGIGDGKLLWKQLEGVRTEEDRGKIGRDNKKLLTLVKGMIKEWMTLVAGQPFKAQMAYTDIDKATKRMDQRAVLQILSRKPKFLTTSWVKTTKAGLLALGATSQIGDNYATEVGRKKLAADEPPLREAACKLLGMILDPHNKEILALIHKCTSRRCAWVCLSVCIAVLRIRTSGGACVCLRFARACSRALLRLPKTDFLETRERGCPAAGVARGSICLGSCVCVPSGGAGPSIPPSDCRERGRAWRRCTVTPSSHFRGSQTWRSHFFDAQKLPRRAPGGMPRSADFFEVTDRANPPCSYNPLW